MIFPLTHKPSAIVSESDDYTPPTPDDNYEVGVDVAMSHMDDTAPFILMNPKAIARFTHLDVREHQYDDDYHTTQHGYAWEVG